jgi:hypothetical protein
MNENSQRMEQGTTVANKAIGCVEAFRRDPRHGIGRCEVHSLRGRLAGVNLKHWELGLFLYRSAEVTPLKHATDPTTFAGLVGGKDGCFMAIEPLPQDLPP